MNTDSHWISQTTNERIILRHSIVVVAFTLAQARIDRRKKEQATKDQDDQIKFVELETAAIEIKIIDFIVSGEEITFTMLNAKLMISELKQIEIARILFHWITAQVRFQIVTQFSCSYWLRQRKGPI